jgi:hypothetical protein
MAQPAVDVTDNQGRTAVLPRLKSTPPGGFTAMSRITRNTQTPPPVRSTPPAQNHTNGTTTPATNTPANQTTATNRVHELTQAARFVRAGLERTLTTSANALQKQHPKEQRKQSPEKACQAVIDAYRLSSDTGAPAPIAAARELATQLQNGDENFRKQLMREFLLHPDLSDEDRAQILQAVGGDTLPASSRTPITEDERQIIVQSLGQLYQGAVNDQALQNALSRIVEMEFAMSQGPGNHFTDSPDRIARLIAESGSPRLKELYANEVLSRLFRTSGTLVAPEYMANSLVCVLNSDPDLFEKVILQQLAPVSEDGQRVVNSDKMASFVSMLIRTNERKMNGQSVDYLSLFFSALSGASRKIQERAFIAIVQGLNGTIGSQPQVMEALANLYTNQPERLTTYFMGAGLGDIGEQDGLPKRDSYEDDYSTRLANFSRFWQYTLYSPVVSDETKSRLAEAIGKAVSAYHTMPSGLLLGRLAGTILGGFIQRVQQQQEQYEAYRGLATAIFGILQAPIRGIARPVSQQIANQAADIIARQLVEKGGLFGFGSWQHRDPNRIDANAVLEQLRYVFGFGQLGDTDGIRNGANSEQNNFSLGIMEAYQALQLRQYVWMR